jgi:hypothetical protein
MMLIQIQFIKQELMMVLGAMDELMQDNQFNLQLMAAIPAVCVGSVGMYAARGTVLGVMDVAGMYGRRRLYSKQQALHELHLAIRELIFVLLPSSSAASYSPHLFAPENTSVSNATSASWAAATGENGWALAASDSAWVALPKLNEGGGSNGGSDCVFEWIAAGHVVLLVHRMQQLLETHRGHFTAQALRWLHQDISALKCSKQQTSQLEILRLMAADLSGTHGATR